MLDTALFFLSTQQIGGHLHVLPGAMILVLMYDAAGFAYFEPHVDQVALRYYTALTERGLVEDRGWSNPSARKQVLRVVDGDTTKAFIQRQSYRPPGAGREVLACGLKPTGRAAFIAQLAAQQFSESELEQTLAVVRALAPTIQSTVKHPGFIIRNG